MGTQEETYERGLRMLAGWLQFLGEKEQELQEQLAKMQAQGGAPVSTSSDAGGAMADDWLDESLPSSAPSAPTAAPVASAAAASSPEPSASAGEAKVKKPGRRRAADASAVPPTPSPEASDEEEMPNWLK